MDNVKSNRTDNKFNFNFKSCFFHVFDHGALQFQQNDLTFLGEVNGVVKYLKSKKKSKNGFHIEVKVEIECSSLTSILKISMSSSSEFFTQLHF